MSFRISPIVYMNQAQAFENGIITQRSCGRCTNCLRNVNIGLDIYIKGEQKNTVNGRQPSRLVPIIPQMVAGSHHWCWIVSGSTIGKSRDYFGNVWSTAYLVTQLVFDFPSVPTQGRTRLLVLGNVATVLTSGLIWVACCLAASTSKNQEFVLAIDTILCNMLSISELYSLNMCFIGSVTDHLIVSLKIPFQRY